MKCNHLGKNYWTCTCGVLDWHCQDCSEGTGHVCPPIQPSTNKAFTFMRKQTWPMREQELRNNIANAIKDFADKGYEGALTSDDPNVLATATFIKEALSHAEALARGQK